MFFTTPSILGIFAKFVGTGSGILILTIRGVRTSRFWIEVSKGGDRLHQPWQRTADGKRILQLIPNWLIEPTGAQNGVPSLHQCLASLELAHSIFSNLSPGSSIGEPTKPSMPSNFNGKSTHPPHLLTEAEFKQWCHVPRIPEHPSMFPRLGTDSLGRWDPQTRFCLRCAWQLCQHTTIAAPLFAGNKTRACGGLVSPPHLHDKSITREKRTDAVI